MSLRLDTNTAKPWRVMFSLNLVEFTETFYFLVNSCMSFPWWL